MLNIKIQPSVYHLIKVKWFRNKTSDIVRLESTDRERNPNKNNKNFPSHPVAFASSLHSCSLVRLQIILFLILCATIFFSSLSRLSFISFQPKLLWQKSIHCKTNKLEWIKSKFIDKLTLSLAHTLWIENKWQFIYLGLYFEQPQKHEIFVQPQHPRLCMRIRNMIYKRIFQFHLILF